MHGRFASFLRGMYFIRFPFLLWLIVLILGPIDMWTGVATFTRGILTPESYAQAATESFMIVSSGMIVLLLVRIIAVNGDERFEATCPDKNGEWVLLEESWLHKHWGGSCMSIWHFLVAHIASVVLLASVVVDICGEIVSVRYRVEEFAAMLGGIAMAYLFWLLVGLVYYWTFDPGQSANPVPREVIFPRCLIPLSSRGIHDVQNEPPPPLSSWLRPVFERIARLGRGFASQTRPTHLYEGHRLGFLAFVGLAILYDFFFNFTAPVRAPVPWASLVSNAPACVAVMVALAGCALGPWPTLGAVKKVKILALLVQAFFLGIVIWVWGWGPQASRGFSVLGSVLILLIGIVWILSILSFVFDGTRLPVLATTVVALVLLKAIYPSEHYFTVFEQSTHPYSEPPQPREILRHRLASDTQASANEFSPLIVITAEGGGIHSAAWTANVLADLEKTFHDAGAPEFHSRVLLASGVSGGSVGLLPFVREYTAGRDGFPPARKNADGTYTDPVHDRLTLAADCSSLQAIAWGLSYYDALSFLAPFPIHPLSGIAAPNTLPAGLDRSWALERSLDRNLSDEHCGDDPKATGDDANHLQDPSAITLSSTAALLQSGDMPAFTFNTTAAETGGRYLLSNYELLAPHMPGHELGTDILPAESFLHTFRCDPTDRKKCMYADMPLATAARLSATFPYVSSASRVPWEVSVGGLHFIDGGYYDNDGTASAMEFLYFALQDNPCLPVPPATLAGDAACAGEGPEKTKSKLVKLMARTRRLPVLLVEIRNDKDIDTSTSTESYTAQHKQNARWGSNHQMIAPIEGFYEAGHVSDAFRNRRELCIFETAFQDRLDIHHLIFDYRNSQDLNQPLSWDLTQAQQKSIACGIDSSKPGCSSYGKLAGESAGRSIHNLSISAAEWMKDPQHAMLPDEPCQSVDVNSDDRPHE